MKYATELTDEQKAQLKVVTTLEHPVRGSYIKIFKFEENKQNGKLEKSVQVLVPKEATETIKALRNAAKMAYIQGWGNKAPLPGFRNPLRDGDKEGGPDLGGLPKGKRVGQMPEFNNHFFFNCKNTQDIVIKNQRNEDILEQGSGIKSGDYLRISCVAYPYNTGGDGIAFSLRGVQLLKEGEALGGDGSSAANDFGEVPMAEDMGASGDIFKDGNQASQEALPAGDSNNPFG